MVEAENIEESMDQAPAHSTTPVTPLIKRKITCMTLDRDEIIEEVNLIFTKFDVDNNGVLDLEEIRPYFFGLRAKHDRFADAVFEDFFCRLDTNSDQEISKVELFRHIWELQYGNDEYAEEIEEEDFETAQQKLFCFSHE